MSSNDIRKFINIVEGRQYRRKINEGWLDKIAGAFGSKKAQGRVDTDKATKMMLTAWQKWVDRTGVQGTTTDMLNFLTSEVDFTPEEAKQIMSGFATKTSRQHEADVKESRRRRFSSRLMEAPAIPLSDGQVKKILNSAIKFAYKNNVWNKPGNAAQQQGNSKDDSQGNSGNNQSSSQGSNSSSSRSNSGNGNSSNGGSGNSSNSGGSGSSNSGSNSNSGSSGGNNSGSNNNSSNNASNNGNSGNQQNNDQKSDIKVPGSVLSNLKKYGFSLEDIQDMSWQIRNNKITPQDLTSEDAKQMAVVGWAYLKSLQY